MAADTMDDGNTFELDDDGGQEDGERGPRGDPPQWDGEDVARRWKKYKRKLLLWQENTRLPKERQGLRVWRRMTGKATDIAEHVPDTTIQAVDSVQKIIEHFEKEYRDILAGETDAGHDDLIYQGTRANTMTFVEYVENMQADWHKYETAVAPMTLPEKLKARLLLRHAKLTDAQTAKVTTRLDGDASQLL